MSTPALALIGADGEIEHSTETFRLRYEDKAELCRQSPQIERVLAGDADRAAVTLEGVSGEVEAMIDSAGARHVLLTLPSESAPGTDDHNALLADALEESPAIAWQKDLDGRYLQVNRTFASLLGVTLERVKGQTDLELKPSETVDGPRVHERGVSPDEPLQFEYTVPSFEKRPPMAVLRFPVRDLAGNAIAVCGVAAPFEQAHVARDEAARLFEIERWSRLDPTALRAELLNEWGVAPGGNGHAEVVPLRPSAAGSHSEPCAAGSGVGARRRGAACGSRGTGGGRSAGRRACTGAGEAPRGAARAGAGECAGGPAGRGARERADARASAQRGARAEPRPGPGAARGAAPDSARCRLGGSGSSRRASEGGGRPGPRRGRAGSSRGGAGSDRAGAGAKRGPAGSGRGDRGSGRRAGGPGRGGVRARRGPVGGQASRAVRARRPAAASARRARRGRGRAVAPAGRAGRRAGGAGAGPSRAGPG